MVKEPLLAEEDFLYSRIADRLELQIENRTLKAGDKLMSLRALSKEQGISLSTAYKAYAELENKGIVEARAKSGYFVRFSKAQYPKSPEVPASSTCHSENKCG
jgi:DNA-binding GntR family transcriptional regulator